jgi:hypothetical protein
MIITDVFDCVLIDGRVFYNHYKMKYWSRAGKPVESVKEGAEHIPFFALGVKVYHEGGEYIRTVEHGGKVVWAIPSYHTQDPLVCCEKTHDWLESVFLKVTAKGINSSYKE